jgi:erythromycin esterase
MRAERFIEQSVGTAGIVAEQLRTCMKPLQGDDDLDPLLARIGDARYVLLGEATHGTSEFYSWRARLSRRLIREKGFSFVACEGDWPDCYRVNRFVKGRPNAGHAARDVLHAFDRWPTWMWANDEVVDFAEWLKAHNATMAEDDKVGFYGLDVYSLWDSIRAVVAYLERIDPEAARRAKRAYECFAPYRESAEDYALATALAPASCENEVTAVLTRLRNEAAAYREDGRDSYFDAEQNALTAKNAELYYRTMVRGGAASWNVRDRHMVETLDRLMRLHGDGAKAIVWEHNTHIGDARYTDMALDGEVNVGQLTREGHEAEGVVLVGFSTYRGSVIAGDEWGAPMRRMRVPKGWPGSYEDVLHRLGETSCLLLLSDAPRTPELLQPRGHRAIGVVYHPQYEQYGNYVPTVLPRRYDALLFIDVTRALAPLHLVERTEAEPPETYPTGL